MDHPLISLIDQRIRDAERRGEFDNLPGTGKPLPNVSNPEDALLNRLMKEHGAKSPLVILREQIVEAKARVSAEDAPAARKAAQKELADLQTRLAIEIEAHRKFG